MPPTKNPASCGVFQHLVPEKAWREGEAPVDCAILGARPSSEGKMRVGRVAAKGFVGCTRHPPVFILKIGPMAMNPSRRERRPAALPTWISAASLRGRVVVPASLQAFLAILAPGQASCFPVRRPCRDCSGIRSPVLGRVLRRHSFALSVPQSFLAAKRGFIRMPGFFWNMAFFFISQAPRSRTLR